VGPPRPLVVLEVLLLLFAAANAVLWHVSPASVTHPPH